jgi:hypothetical protein
VHEGYVVQYLQRRIGVEGVVDVHAEVDALSFEADVLRQLEIEQPDTLIRTRCSRAGWW